MLPPRRSRIAFLRTLPWLAATVLLASCAGDGSTLDPFGQPLPPARAIVEIAAIERSLVEGATSQVAIEVKNEGGLPLRILAVAADADFLVPSFPGPISIAAGDSTEITVGLEAGSAASSPLQGTITIATDDPDNPAPTVFITLNVAEEPIPDIEVSPGQLDVTVGVGELGTATVTISNAGSGLLTLTGALVPAAWIVPRALPAPLAPGASVDLVFDVTATTLALGGYATTLTLESDDPDEPAVAVPVDLWVGPFRPTLSAVQANVFTPACAWCHESSTSYAGLGLADGDSWALLVGVPSVEADGLDRVTPGNPDDSFLVIKLEGTDPRMVGSPMPVGGSPLAADVIAVVREWIQRGALDD